MQRNRLGAAAAWAIWWLLAGVACGGASEVHSVRGQVVRPADQGQSLTVDHEAVPGLMEAMRMTLPLQDPPQALGLSKGDKIRFELYRYRGRGSIGKIERLPADAELVLASPDASG